MSHPHLTHDSLRAGEIDIEISKINAKITGIDTKIANKRVEFSDAANRKDVERMSQVLDSIMDLASQRQKLVDRKIDFYGQPWALNPHSSD